MIHNYYKVNEHFIFSLKNNKKKKLRRVREKTDENEKLFFIFLFFFFELVDLFLISKITRKILSIFDCQRQKLKKKFGLNQWNRFFFYFWSERSKIQFEKITKMNNIISDDFLFLFYSPVVFFFLKRVDVVFNIIVLSLWLSVIETMFVAHIKKLIK